MDKLPSAEVLASLLDYCADTGLLTWRARPLEMFNSERAMKSWNTRNAGCVAGIPKTDGGKTYIKFTLLGKTVLAHRVIVKILYGIEPDQIDHRDGDGTNNRKLNIRVSTLHKNHKNKRRSTVNRSGCTGVFIDGARGVFSVEITSDGVRHFLGRFTDFLEACCVRKSAERRFNFDFQHGSSRPL